MVIFEQSAPRCYDRAREVRALAAKATVPDIKRQLLHIAAQYDTLAAESWADEALQKFNRTRAR